MSDEGGTKYGCDGQSVGAAHTGESRYGRRTLLAGLTTGAFVLAGCRSPTPGQTTASPDSTATTVLSEDWEDGNRDGWLDYVDGGTATVERLSVPDGGTYALSVEQSEGGGTFHLVGTRPRLGGWDGPWTVRTLFHTTKLDPATPFQLYHLVPSYEPGTDTREPVSLRLGVRNGSGRHQSARLDSTGVTNEKIYPIEWEQARWYRVEFAHDGVGGYTARIWPAERQRPAEPNVVGSGPVPEPGEKALGFRVNGSSSPRFQFSHAFVEYRSFG